MAIKFCNNGFEFPSDFGFSGSATKSHPQGHAKGGPVRKAMGGPQRPMGVPAAPAVPPGNTAEPTISMPASTAMRMGKGLVQAGALQGAKAAAAHLAGGPAAAPRPPMPLPAPAAAAPPGGGMAGMAKGGFIKKAIKHPGRETERAQRTGRSVHEQMEHDKHSNDPSLRGAANLGLRLTGGDLKPHKRKG